MPPLPSAATPLPSRAASSTDSDAAGSKPAASSSSSSSGGSPPPPPPSDEPFLQTIVRVAAVVAVAAGFWAGLSYYRSLSLTEEERAKRSPKVIVTHSSGSEIEPPAPHWPWDAYERGGAAILLPIEDLRMVGSMMVSAADRAALMKELKSALVLSKREMGVAAMRLPGEEDAPTASDAASLQHKPLTVADVLSAQSDHPLPDFSAASVEAALAASTATHASVVPATGAAPQAVMAFAILTMRAAHSHAQATYLLDNPVGWQADDAVRVAVASELLATSLQQSLQSLVFYQRNAAALCGKLGPNVARVWSAWSQVSDALVRMGDKSQTTAACQGFTAAVAQHVALASTDQVAAEIARAGCSRVVSERMARVCAAEGSWADAELHLTRVLQSFAEHERVFTQAGAVSRPQIASLATVGAGGHELEIVETLAALSYVALMRRRETSAVASSSFNLDLALHRAQHAVALMAVQSEKQFMASAPELRQADQENVKACKLGANSDSAASTAATAAQQTPPPLGWIPYSELLSLDATERVLNREMLLAQAVLLSAASGFAHESGQQVAQARNQAYLLKRRRDAGIVYQQLGFALEAKGEREQAQQAFAAAKRIGRFQL